MCIINYIHCSQHGWLPVIWTTNQIAWQTIYRTLSNECHCNYIQYFFFCVQGYAVGRHSGCAVQCTDYKNVQLEGYMQPTFFRGWFISPGCICLNRMVVPTFCATSSHSFSAPDLQNSPSPYLLWVPHHHLLPVQITFLFRNHLKPIPRCPQWHPKYFQVQSPPFPLVC